MLFSGLIPARFDQTPKGPNARTQKRPQRYSALGDVFGQVKKLIAPSADRPNYQYGNRDIHLFYSVLFRVRLQLTAGFGRSLRPAYVPRTSSGGCPPLGMVQAPGLGRAGRRRIGRSSRVPPHNLRLKKSNSSVFFCARPPPFRDSRPVFPAALMLRLGWLRRPA